jgi:hypothetical protein
MSYRVATRAGRARHGAALARDRERPVAGMSQRVRARRHDPNGAGRVRHRAWAAASTAGVRGSAARPTLARADAREPKAPSGRSRANASATVDAGAHCLIDARAPFERPARMCSCPVHLASSASSFSRVRSAFSNAASKERARGPADPGVDSIPRARRPEAAAVQPSAATRAPTRGVGASGEVARARTSDPW